MDTTFEAIIKEPLPSPSCKHLGFDDDNQVFLIYILMNNILILHYSYAKKMKEVIRGKY